MFASVDVDMVDASETDHAVLPVEKKMGRAKFASVSTSKNTIPSRLGPSLIVFEGIDRPDGRVYKCHGLLFPVSMRGNLFPRRLPGLAVFKQGRTQFALDMRLRVETAHVLPYTTLPPPVPGPKIGK